MSKVIVITGASGGIGEALALRLSRDGHKLVLAARREAELTAVAKACGTHARAVVTDVTVRPQVERLRDAALKAFGQVDVWVNNAGRGIAKSVLELEDDELDEMMLVNVKSALYGMQAIVPHFQKRNAGQLINVSSFLGRVPLAPVRSAYNAAKHALNALTANLRMDLRQSHPGVHVTLVMPGLVSTDFAKNALHSDPRSAPPKGTPSQTPEEAADAIARVIDQPVPEIFTNPALGDAARRYFADVAAFEAGTR